MVKEAIHSDYENPPNYRYADMCRFCDHAEYRECLLDTYPFHYYCNKYEREVDTTFICDEYYEI